MRLMLLLLALIQRADDAHVCGDCRFELLQPTTLYWYYLLLFASPLSMLQISGYGSAPTQIIMTRLSVTGDSVPSFSAQCIHVGLAHGSGNNMHAF